MFQRVAGQTAISTVEKLQKHLDTVPENLIFVGEEHWRGQNVDFLKALIFNTKGDKVFVEAPFYLNEFIERFVTNGDTFIRQIFRDYINDSTYVDESKLLLELVTNCDYVDSQYIKKIVAIDFNSTYLVSHTRHLEYLYAVLYKEKGLLLPIEISKDLIQFWSDIESLTNDLLVVYANDDEMVQFLKKIKFEIDHLSDNRPQKIIKGKKKFYREYLIKRNIYEHWQPNSQLSYYVILGSNHTRRDNMWDTKKFERKVGLNIAFCDSLKNQVVVQNYYFDSNTFYTVFKRKDFPLEYNLLKAMYNNKKTELINVSSHTHVVDFINVYYRQ